MKHIIGVRMSNKYYRTKQFIELQNKWYDKLSKLGFNDLEWLDKKTGSGQSSPFLKGSLSKFKHLDVQTLQTHSEYFTDATNFTSLHNFPSRLHKFMWSMFAEGVSYRKMIPRIASRGFKHVPSIFWISTELGKLKKFFWIWQSQQEDIETSELQNFMESNGPIDISST